MVAACLKVAGCRAGKWLKRWPNKVFWKSRKARMSVKKIQLDLAARWMLRLFDRHRRFSEGAGGSVSADNRDGKEDRCC